MNQFSASDIVKTATGLLASRYFTGGAFAILLWDHLITLDREVELIWKSHGRARRMLRSAFTFNRYGNEVFFLFIACVTSGVITPSPDLCRRYFMVIAFVSTTSAEISHFVLLLRLHMLMDHHRIIVLSLVGAFTLAVTLSHVFAIATVIQLRTLEILAFPEINACLMVHKPRFLLGILAPMCGFTTVIITLAIYNALERPHKDNGEFFKSLYKDGAPLFMVGTLMHIANLVTAASSSMENFLILMYAFWALNSVLVSRLHFTMEKHLNYQNEDYSRLTFYSTSSSCD